MAQNVKPTRSELLVVKKKIKLAKSGHNLLKKKRDGLIMEFFGILKDAKGVRKELLDEYKIAQDRIKQARVLDTDLEIRSVAMALKERPAVELGSKNIMGVKVPTVKKESGGEHTLLDRGYGVLSGSARIDEAAIAFERVVEKIILAAELDITMKKLLQEIERTKRKVNALEFVAIPNMEASAKYIQLRLEEMERENFSRLKIIKKNI